MFSPRIPKLSNKTSLTFKKSSHIQALHSEKKLRPHAWSARVGCNLTLTHIYISLSLVQPVRRALLFRLFPRRCVCLPLFNNLNSIAPQEYRAHDKIEQGRKIWGCKKPGRCEIDATSLTEKERSSRRQRRCHWQKWWALPCDQPCVVLLILPPSKAVKLARLAARLSLGLMVTWSKVLIPITIGH